MTHPLLPDLPGFSIEHVTIADGVILVQAQSQRESGACPDCTHLSSRVHSRYQRTLADLPWSGRIVRLVVQVCRFFCQHPSCPRKTFAEPIPELASRYARQTIRLKEVLERLGLALGGEPASRLTVVLGMVCSPDTLLRMLRRLPDDPLEPPRVVSLDDWAWRRGSRYGTIICDLERHRRLDVLPDRDAASAAAWLKRYPSIEIISRDRGGEYAEAARAGAPQAVQVADRFHLSQNLHEAIDQAVRRCYPKIHQLLSPAQAVLLGEDLPLKRDDAAKAATQKRRMARYERVKVLHEQGYSLAQMAAYLGMKHETVQKYLMEPPRPPVYKPRHGKLTRYKPYIHQRFFQEGCRNSLQIFREMQQQGYTGGSTIVVNYVTQLRQLIGEPSTAGPVMRTKPTPLKAAVPSPREIAWWFCLPVNRLPQKQQDLLLLLREADSELDELYHLAQTFFRLIRDHSSSQLTPWMDNALESQTPELRSFARGLGRDEIAVRAGLDLPWSQGQTEGQITRLKLIKRQGYGRAKFDLLRQRVLHAA
jgi:transposase